MKEGSKLINMFGLLLNKDKSLKASLSNTLIPAKIFKITKENNRSIIIKQGTIEFEEEKQGQLYNFVFKGLDQNGQQQELAPPVHPDMNLRNYIDENGQICFEWLIDQEKKGIIGCILTADNKPAFVETVYSILHQLDGGNYKQLKQFEQEIKKPQVKMTVSRLQKTRVKKKAKDLSVSVISQNQFSISCLQKSLQDIKQECKSQGKDALFVEEGKLIVNKEVRIIFFVVKQLEKYDEVRFVDPKGQVIQKMLNNKICFEFEKKSINLTNYNRQDHTRYIVQFRDEETAKKLERVLKRKSKIIHDRDSRYKFKKNEENYLSQIKDEGSFSYDQSQQQSNTFLNQRELNSGYPSFLSEVKVQGYCQNDSYSHKQNMGKYLYLCQSQVKNLWITSLGNILQILEINGSNINLVGVVEYKKDKKNFNKIILFDNDSRALLKSRQGTLHIFDIHKKTISDSLLPKQCKIQDVCQSTIKYSPSPQFKAITNHQIMLIDLRHQSIIKNKKDYSGNTGFSVISPTQNPDNFACGSRDGKYRLYKQLGKNASNQLDGKDSQIQHMEASRNSDLLLVSFMNHLELAHTLNSTGSNMYEKRSNKDNRREAIVLSLDAKEKKGRKLIKGRFGWGTERGDLILSGYENKLIVWSLQDVKKGGRKYNTIEINVGEIVQAEFLTNHKSRILVMGHSQICLIDL